MRYALSPASRRTLSALARPGTLIVFDFDGTLAPIVRRPGQAAIKPSLLRQLRALAKLAPVAVLSGRARADVRRRCAFPLVACLGNHGLEGLPGGHRESRVARAKVRAWSRHLHGEKLGAGVTLENKTYSLSLHFRESANPTTTERRLKKIVAQLQPPARALPGKRVLNLLPGHRTHKGSALRRLQREGRWPRVVFVGDDDTDEDVFRLGGRGLYTVRVGHKRGSRAHAYLKTQGELGAWLAYLVASLQK